MVGTRRRAKLVQDSGSESDAPEQVTLSSGREAAKKLRNEERENQKRVQAEAKQRRQRSLVKKKEIVPSGEQQDDTVKDVLEEAANPAQEEEALKFSKPGKISGFLDSSIIDFLSAQERKVEEISTTAPEEENPRVRNRTGKRKGKKAISSSRVKIVLLEGDRPSSANYQSALEFKSKRLFGDHVHRSLVMLKPRSVQ